MKSLACVALATTCLTAGAARGATAPAPLAGIMFLLGNWSNGQGRAADTGGRLTGTSVFTAEAGGAVLLRRDHTETRDSSGKPAASFAQIMMIYAEGGQIRAEYADGSHIIHYASASVTPGHAVTFTSAAGPGAPTFKLSYTLQNLTTLAVRFVMTPPGGGPDHPIATGTLTREKS